MLLNTARIARATGFSRWYVEAVKAQPDSPFRGGRYATQQAFEAWVMDHPHFRASHHWAARKEQRRLARGLAARVAGKSGAPIGSL